jgi:hypothetical protein
LVAIREGDAVAVDCRCLSPSPLDASIVSQTGLYMIIQGHRDAFILMTLLAASSGCKEKRIENASSSTLIGSWAESDGGVRKYAFGPDNGFTMTIGAGGCDGGAGSVIVSNGTWSVDGSRLIMKVETSSDPIFGGSTMTDQIVERSADRLVLRSSVATCSGQLVRLVRR